MQYLFHVIQMQYLEIIYFLKIIFVLIFFVSSNFMYAINQYI